MAQQIQKLREGYRARLAGQKEKIACIVIPTYNEAGNIVELLDKIYYFEKTKRCDYLIHVLVVDDNSPDGTARVVKKYSIRNKRVHLLKRKEKEGLGRAYIAGMKHAMDLLGPEVIFEMDGDHSHNPKDIFRMLEEIDKGHDFVIGSRYVDGGGVPEDWGMHRKVISFFASNISKIGLGLRGVKDTSGGFRAIRTEVLETINLDSLNVRGYAFQTVLLESALHHKFDVKEIPINFENRTNGESKMRFNDMMEGWTVIFKIRSKRMGAKVKETFGIL